MKKFQFKLQALLTLRQRAEQTALEVYSRAVLARQASMNRLSEIEQALASARVHLQEQTRHGCPAATARQLEGHCRQLENGRDRAREALVKAELELNQTFQRLLLARQEREAVETYLAHEQNHYERELAREERKIIDDIVSHRSVTSLFGRLNSGNAWN